MGLNTFPKDITEASESVHSFLRLCFLVRVKSRKDGGYTLENIRYGSLLLGFVLFFADLYLMITERLNAYTEVLSSMLEVFTSCTAIIRLIVTLYQASNENENKVRKEIDNLTALDEVFGIRSSYTYRKDRLVFNRIFFITLGLRIFSSLSWATCYSFTYGIHVVVPYTVQFLISFLLSASVIYNASKLKLYTHRLSEMKRQTDRVGQPVRDARIDHNTGFIDYRKIRFCYLKIYENCVLFNERHGLQILLCHADITVTTMTTISFSTKEESLKNVTIIIAHISLLIMEIVPIIILLVLATSMLHTSKAISLVIERALMKNNFDSERERASWEEFVELAHRCPLVLTAYDFFPLDYSLIGATFGTIVTYTIIVTQLYN